TQGNRRSVPSKTLIRSTALGPHFLTERHREARARPYRAGRPLRSVWRVGHVWMRGAALGRRDRSHRRERRIVSSAYLFGDRTMNTPTIAEQIIAVEEAIAAERKGLIVVRMPELKIPIGAAAEYEQRIARLEAAIVTLRRAAAAS